MVLAGLLHLTEQDWAEKITVIHLPKHIAPKLLP